MTEIDLVRSPKSKYRSTADWDRRWKRLLTRARKHPLTVLDDARCHSPSFCNAFFDVCDDKALRDPAGALHYAETAVELAKKTGDPHLALRGMGVVAHAHIARQEWEEALNVLDDYGAAVKDCCASCQGDWLWRLGDLLVETRDAKSALGLLNHALLKRLGELDRDVVGRIEFVRSIALHFLGKRDFALRDADGALRNLSLSSPRGYFLDALAFIGCFLEGGERRHDIAALESLERFKKRLKGLKDWQEVHTRLSWVEGLVHGRLGDVRRSNDRLESTCRKLVKTGPVRQALASTLDLGQLLACRCIEANARAVARVIETCLLRYPAKSTRGGGWKSLDPAARRRLEKVKGMLRTSPAKAFDELVALRGSFIAPVPGLLAEIRDRTDEPDDTPPDETPKDETPP